MSVVNNIEQQAVLTGLNSRDNDDIRSAAFDAGDMRLKEAIPMLCNHIKSRNVGVQEAAEYALRKIRGSETVEKMIPYLHSDDSSLRNVAMDILREIGNDDVAQLCALLRNPDADIRIFIADILGHTQSRQAVQPLCEALLKDPEVNVRYQAAMSLGTLAFPEASDALHQAMQDEEWVQFSVVEALTKIRADSTINTLVQSLNTCSPLVASIIIDALGEIQNIKAVPLLLKFIEKAPEVLRHKTVKTIVQILGPESLCLISENDQIKLRTYLEEALTDEDEDVQLIALTGLSAMGKDSASKAIMVLLMGIARKSESDLYQAAIAALAEIGYNDVFAQYLEPSNPQTVRFACTACLQMQSAECAPKLQEIFSELDRDSQRLAAQYLAKHCTEKDAPYMLSILQNTQDENVAKSAIAFLGSQLSYEPAQEDIFKFLAHPYNDVKEVALEACIHLNTPTLNELFSQWMGSEDEEQRMMAVYALAAFGLRKNYATILRALDDPYYVVRQLAVESFAQQDVSLHDHLDILLKMLQDESPEVRTSVISVLGASYDSKITPYIINALDDENEWVCIRAIDALHSAQVSNLTSTLLERLAHATPIVTLKIIEVLSELGEEEALDALLKLVQHDVVEIRQAASEAIAKIKVG